MYYFDPKLKLISTQNSLTLDHLSKEYHNLMTFKYSNLIHTLWNENAQIKQIDQEERLQNVWKSDKEFDSLFQCVEYLLNGKKIEVIPASWFLTNYLFFLPDLKLSFTLDVVIERLNCKEQLFYYGEEAKTVVQELVDLSVTRMPNTKNDNELAVLIIDRVY
jgi:hypothetical protein